MASQSRNERFICTLLDRFFMDEERGVARSVQEDFSFQEYLKSIQSDLRDLLNTRQTLNEEALGGLEHVRQSLLLYGLPELNSVSYVSAGTAKLLAGAMEAAIRQFEPRLMGVKVTSSESSLGEVRFRVEAMARVEPRPQRVAFDTTLDLDTHQCEVEVVL